MTTTQRRGFLRMAAAIAALAALPIKAVRAAWPTDAFSADKISVAIESLYGSPSFEESDGVQLKAPEIAENGAIVPITVNANFPAKSIAVLVEKNPQSLAASFSPSGGLPSTSVSTRIKIGESSMVVAVAQTADGKILGASKLVKVTIGGCGG